MQMREATMMQPITGPQGSGGLCLRALLPLNLLGLLLINP